MFGTGVSDSVLKVEVKRATFGGYYADVGAFQTKVYQSPRQAAEAGNALGRDVYGSTVRLIDTNQFI